MKAHLAVRFTFFFAFARCNDFARSGKASISSRATIYSTERPLTCQWCGC